MDPKKVPDDEPKPVFPHKISKRLLLLSIPRRIIVDTGEGDPAITDYGVRRSAVRATCPDRVADAAWPFTRRMVLTKRMYRTRFSDERIERIDRMIEVANATIYSKLANCVMDLKKQEAKRRRAWTESDWKKHMEYINQIAGPKTDFRPKAIKRGPWKPLDELMPRINQICFFPEFKVYRRLSKEVWYRDPIKVPPNALKYVISDRVKKLATPKVIPMP